VHPGSVSLVCEGGVYVSVVSVNLTQPIVVPFTVTGTVTVVGTGVQITSPSFNIIGDVVVADSSALIINTQNGHIAGTTFVASG